MKIQIFNSITSQLYLIQVSPDSQIEIVKTSVSFDTGVPAQKQILRFGGNILLDHERLNQLGVKENDVLYFEVIPPLDIRNPLSGISLASVTASNLQRYIINHKELYNHIQRTIPKLYEGLLKFFFMLLIAVIANSPNKMETYLKPIREQFRKKYEQERENQLRAVLQRDPMNVDAQKELEDRIRSKNLKENMELAMEFKPELFGRVFMLYIRLKINGIELQAFVDTGAQITIMNGNLAKRCNLMRLLDRRFSGVAKGVGTAKILGRVHMVQLQIGKLFFNHNMTIIDQQDNDLTFILGLDFLKSYQVVIDLEKGNFIIKGESVPFLPEKDCPETQFNIRTPTTPTRKNDNTFK